MKRYKFSVSIGFKPEEVNAILRPEQMAKLQALETDKKLSKRIRDHYLNIEKFKVQQKGNIRKIKKFPTKSFQIERGFNLAKKWRQEWEVLHPKEEKENDK